MSAQVITPDMSVWEIERLEAKGAQPRRVGRALVQSLCGVQPERIAFLWGGYMPKGKVILAEGEGDVGKTTVFLGIVAALSQGRPLPNTGEPTEPCDSLFITAEDGIADTIVPRLKAAGADLTRVHTMDGVLPRRKDAKPEDAAPIQLPRDIDALEEVITATGAKLVVFDPIFSFVQGNPNDEKDARAVTSPLKRVAERTGAVIVLIRHFTKATDRAASHRGGGSVAWRNAVRASLMFTRHPEDEDLRVMAVNKGNLVKRELRPALAYRLTDCDGAAVAEWAGPVDYTPDELVRDDRRQTGGGAKRQEAEGFLREALADGEVHYSNDLLEQAEERGISRRTLHRARKAIPEIKVDREVGGERRWRWRLPCRAECQECQ